MQQPHSQDLAWMIKRLKFNCSLKQEMQREGSLPGAGDVVLMGGVTSPCLGAPVDDFMVLGAGTGRIVQALTPSAPRKAGPLLLGKWEKLLRFLPWSLSV